MDSIKRKNKFKKIGIVTGVLVIIVAAYCVVAWNGHLFPFTEDDATPDPGTQTINLNKSKSEKQATSDLEKNPEKKLENNQTDTPPIPTTNPDSGKQVTNVLITNAGIFNGKVSASGFMTNIVETDGTCEYIFTHDSLKTVKTTTTLPNATSTTCKTVSFSSDELQASGTWSVTLHYVSNESEGMSSAREFNR